MWFYVFLDRPVSHTATFFHVVVSIKIKIIWLCIFSPCVDSLSELHPHRVFGILTQSMHWLVFIVVIHRFKLLNSPWVPLCHVIPPFQPKVWSTQRWKKIAPYFFLVCECVCVHCAFVVVCMIFWFTRLILVPPLSLSLSCPSPPQTLFCAKQYFPSD